MDETRLVHEAQRGSLKSFNRLVARYQDEVFQLVSSLLPGEYRGEHTSAVDLTQAIFVEAFHALPGHAAGSFHAWLLGCALQRARSERARQPAGQPGRAGFSRGLDTLPADLLEPLALVDLCGMDYNQAAAVLGISAGEVSLRLSQARRSLARPATLGLLEYA